MPLSAYKVSLWEPADGSVIPCVCDTFRRDTARFARIVYAGEGTAQGVTNYTYLMKSDVHGHLQPHC